MLTSGNARRSVIHDCKKTNGGSRGYGFVSSIERVRVVVQDDFIERQTRGRPVVALAELIWNSLDGEASQVSVEFDRNDLAGGISKIVVYDDGEGFRRADAAELFGNLGGSWKRLTGHTKKKGRMVHGQEGRGRYKAFALGASVTWKVCYVNVADEPKAFEIRILESNLKEAIIGEETKAPGRSSGVIVEVTDIKRDFKVFDRKEGLQELAEMFALYLINYKDVSIRIGENRLDPESTIANQTRIQLTPIMDHEDREHCVELHLIEWQSDTLRTLYLCSENGFPLEQIEARFHIPGFAFSAYLMSPYISILHNDAQLGIADMVPELRDSVENAP